MTASQAGRGRSRPSTPRRSPACARTPALGVVAAHQVHLGALRRARTRRRAGRSCPVPSTSTRSRRRQAARPHRAQRVAARLDHRAGGVVDPSGSAMQRARPARPAARPAPRDSRRGCRSRAGRRRRVPAGPAARAVPAAEHRVAGDPAPEPGRVDAGAHGRHHPAPLVAEPHRVRGWPVVQVGHLAGEELHVGAAHARPARRRRRPHRAWRPAARRPGPAPGGGR